jgi:hypothetical protein
LVSGNVNIVVVGASVVTSVSAVIVVAMAASGFVIM